MVMVCLVGMASMVSANSGKAIIPQWLSSGTNGTNPYTSVIYISNITNEPINVKVTFYEDDGTVLVDGDNNPNTGTLRTHGNFSNYNDNPGKASISFTLNANSTVYVNSHTTAKYKGFGTIEWDQDSNAVCGLVAFGRGQYYSNGWTFYAIPINNGQPF